MALRIRIAEPAKLEIRDIWWWYYGRTNSEEIANGVLRAFNDQFKVLASTPEIGHPRRDIELERTIASNVGRYVIFYRVEEEILYINRVIHSARDMGAMFPSGLKGLKPDKIDTE